MHSTFLIILPKVRYLLWNLALVFNLILTRFWSDASLDWGGWQLRSYQEEKPVVLWGQEIALVFCHKPMRKQPFNEKAYWVQTKGSFCTWSDVWVMYCPVIFIIHSLCVLLKVYTCMPFSCICVWLMYARVHTFWKPGKVSCVPCSALCLFIGPLTDAGTGLVASKLQRPSCLNLSTVHCPHLGTRIPAQVLILYIKDSSLVIHLYILWFWCFS